MEDVHTCCLGDQGFGNMENNIRQIWGRLYRDRDTEADLIEREREALGSVLGSAEAVAEVLDGRETQAGSLGIFQQPLLGCNRLCKAD